MAFEPPELLVVPPEPLGVKGGDGALQGCGVAEGCSGALELVQLAGWLEGVLDGPVDEFLERRVFPVGAVGVKEGEVEDFAEEPFPRAAFGAPELVELVGPGNPAAVAFTLEERAEPLAGVVGAFSAREAGFDVRDFVVAVILLTHRRSPAPGGFHGLTGQVPARTGT